MSGVSTSCLIVSAGTGSRMCSDVPKQYLELKGIPVFIYSIRAFAGYADEIVLVIRQEDEKLVSHLLSKHAGEYTGIKIAYGGATRQESVYNGLKMVTGDIVLVHDGARPLVSGSIIERVIEGACQRGSCVAAVPVKDTVKQKEESGKVKTLRREELFAVQTPQGFSYKLLIQAYEKAFNEGFTATDDSSVTEYMGIQTLLVEGGFSNIKITTSEDLILADCFIDALVTEGALNEKG